MYDVGGKNINMAEACKPLLVLWTVSMSNVSHNVGV